MFRELFGRFFGQTTSGSVPISVTAADRELTISADKTTVAVGENIKFSGGYMVAGYAAGADIELFKNGVSTGLITHTGQYGSYSITWTATIEDENQTLSFHTEATD